MENAAEKLRRIIAKFVETVVASDGPDRADYNRLKR